MIPKLARVAVVGAALVVSLALPASEALATGVPQSAGSSQMVLTPTPVTSAPSSLTTQVKTVADVSLAQPAAPSTSPKSVIALGRTAAPSSVMLTAQVKPYANFRPAGPNWRCWGNYPGYDFAVCIYVRTYGTKVLSIQGEIWIRNENVIGVWTMTWEPTANLNGQTRQWAISGKSLYGASEFANHWFTPTRYFNRVVPRGSYVSFCFWQVVKGKYVLKRASFFAIL
jgi:hypothetical protein